MNSKNKNNTWFQLNFDFDEIPSKILKPNQDDLNTDESTENVQFKKPRTNKIYIKENWIKLFEPKTVEDLVVNKKKIAEIRLWIENAFCAQKSNHNFLLINGPSGSGKTTTVTLLCKNFGIHILEWITPLDIEYTTENDYGNNYNIKPKQAELFKEFLLQGRFQSLFDKNSTKYKYLIIIKDYPNAFLRDPTEFHNILKIYSYQSNGSPIIFICTDSNDNNKTDVSRILFPQSIRDLFNIHNVSFNPISVTNMKLALKNAVKLMNEKQNLYKSVTDDCISSIVNTSNGDIRNALINLHFSSLKDSASIPLKTATKSIQKTKAKSNKQTKLNNVGCDENLNLMHGIGRVLFPKHEQTSNGIRFFHNPEKLVENFNSMPSNFIAFLFENYSNHFNNLDDLSKGINSLCDADYLMKEWKDKDTFNLYALSIAIRGLIISNKNPTSGWNLIRGPKKIKIDTTKNRLDTPLEEHYSYKDCVLDYLPLRKIIMNDS